MATSANDAIIFRRRLQLLVLGFGLIFVLLVIKLAYLQIVRYSTYTAQATQQQSRKYEIPARRGELFAYNNGQSTPIALDQTLEVVYADPRYVHNEASTAAQLAKILGNTPAHYEALMKSAIAYVELATRVPQGQAARVQVLGLSGIGLVNRDYRVYPEGDLAAQTLGFVDANGVGQYGVEGFLNKGLAGQPGHLAAKTNTLGLPIYTASNIIQEPKNGTNYQLTIDLSVQAEVEKELAAGVKSAQAVSGSAVVVDPSNGDVIAMANYPTYDPNNYSQISDYSVFSNAVVSNAFEPGSTMKIFTMAAGLDQNKVTPDSTYDDTGSFTVDNIVTHNAATDPANGYGITSMTRVLELSLNTGVIYVLRTLGTDINQITAAGKQVLYTYLTQHFNFGKVTGIEQADEETGVVPPPTSSDIDYADMTFGQGISATMIQMTMALAAVVNGGTLYQPHVVAGTINSDGTLNATKPVVVRRHVISAKAASELIGMLVQTVDHGTAYTIHDQNPGYEIAGKTGTAQVASPTGGYIVGKNIGDFLGFAPANNPKFVMMIRINEPGVGGYAETTTVPIFGAISKWLFTYYGIAPTQ